MTFYARINTSHDAMHQRQHIFIIIRYLLSDSYRRIMFMVIHVIFFRWQKNIFGKDDW